MQQIYDDGILEDICTILIKVGNEDTQFVLVWKDKIC
jgi:hypothetical protein